MTTRAEKLAVLADLPSPWPSESVAELLAEVRYDASTGTRRQLLRRRRIIDTGLNDTLTQASLRAFRWKWVNRAAFSAWRSSVAGVK